MLKEQQYNNQAKSGKNEQNQTMVKIGKKIPGNEVRYDMPNPKPKILFSILTLVKNHYIKVLPDKNSCLQWCESLALFCFFA